MCNYIQVPANNINVIENAPSSFSAYTRECQSRGTDVLGKLRDAISEENENRKSQ